MISIGIITKPVGLKGEMKVRLYSVTSSVLDNVDSIFADGTEYVLTDIREHRSSKMIKLRGIDSLEKAEAMKGLTLSVSSEALPALDQDEYYVKDLIGINVVDVKGEKIGTLVDIKQDTAQDIYEIKNPADYAILIPAVKEYIKNIDLKAYKMTVDIPRELKELNLNKRTEKQK